jgi:PAT family beta-lactamase induction signal transducer AmpG
MSKIKKKGWSWIPSLYFAEGIPYVVVMTVSVIMYKRMGISNTDIALYTSWLYLPWVIKPLWSPLVDLVKTKRWWIVTMQLLIGGGLAGVALTIPLPSFFQYTLAFMWLLAFSSATHDIAADGFYMLGLSSHEQAWFVGVRSTFYRIAMITGQGLLIIFAGYVESQTGLETVRHAVNASPQQQMVTYAHPDSLQLDRSESALEIRTLNDELVLNTSSINREKADSLISFASKWNHENGFVVREEASELQLDENGELQGPSAWQEYIVQPLEDGLRYVFGEEIVEITNTTAGNVGYIYFYLSEKPVEGEPIVLNFARDEGDKSISLVEGGRIVFNENNWEKPAIAVVQLDPKLKEVSSASFVGTSGNIPLSWSITFFILVGMFVIFFAYHKFVLPYPASDKPTAKGDEPIFAEFFRTFATFFKKDRIIVLLGFLLFYRFGEAQIVKLASPFLLDGEEFGGLALTTGEVGFVYGTVGMVALTLGGLIGGFVAARHGLKAWLWPMVIAMNLPNAAYLYLATAVPDNFLLVNAAIAVEQFGYGFGFTAYMLYMLYMSKGDHQTAHFAICTGFMALGMMIPGMVSGWIQSILGYEKFFVWVLLATIPGFIVTYLIPLDPEFGKEKDEEEEEPALES